MMHGDHTKEILLFMGPPGSGKGTVSQKWGSEYGYQVLSTGNLCREHIAQETPFGRELNEYISKGLLIPDRLMNAMVRQWLCSAVEKSSRVILDGYPRTKQQVDALMEQMSECAPNFATRVVLFEVTDQTVIGRLAMRLLCSNEDCQRIYTAQAGYTDADRCEACGGSLKKRGDDTEEVVRRRLLVYEKNKQELLEAYRNKNVLVKHFDVDQLSFQELFQQFTQIAASSPAQ